jgi:hypothetical protein
MQKLVAEFNVTLPGHCLYAFPDATDIIYLVPLGDFQVQLILSMMKGSFNRGHGDQNWIGALNRIRVVVSREEVEFPPPVIPDAAGRRDYSIQLTYFQTRIEPYGEAGREITNRMIRYFRFVLGTPHLDEFAQGHQAFRNAKWTNDAGEIVGKGAQTVVFDREPGVLGEMHIGCLSENNRAELEDFLTEPRGFSIAEQMIDNARSAWFDGNFQRSVLELAIACEIVVKRFFFAEDSPAGAAFDYLEDKAKVNIRVLELIDAVAQAAFEKSFKTDCSEDYRNIDYLFRCRNKIAHRGELSLKDDSGRRLVPDRTLIENWFNSVLMLKAWLTN